LHFLFIRKRNLLGGIQKGLGEKWRWGSSGADRGKRRGGKGNSINPSSVMKEGNLVLPPTLPGGGRGKGEKSFSPKKRRKAFFTLLGQKKAREKKRSFHLFPSLKRGRGGISSIRLLGCVGERREEREGGFFSCESKRGNKLPFAFV